jgi:hypothetical protein
MQWPDSERGVCIFISKPNLPMCRFHEKKSSLHVSLKSTKWANHRLPHWRNRSARLWNGKIHQFDGNGAFCSWFSQLFYFNGKNMKSKENGRSQTFNSSPGTTCGFSKIA